LTRTRAQNKNLQVQQMLIDWRRSQIIQLIHKGKTLNEIAEILQLDRSTISRDYQCNKDNAADVMSKYSVDTKPLEVKKY
jgi:IS30 family transposase